MIEITINELKRLAEKHLVHVSIYELLGTFEVVIKMRGREKKIALLMKELEENRPVHVVFRYEVHISRIDKLLTKIESLVNKIKEWWFRKQQR